MKILKSTDYSYLEKSAKENKICFLVALGIGLALLIAGLFSFGLIAAGLFALALAIMFARRRSAAKAGIEGERAITETLKTLDDSYCLIEDVLLPMTRGNIDHVLLSPKRLFIIESKNWTGDIKCYGDEWSKKGASRRYPVESVSKQTKGNAKELSNLIRERLGINAYVTPILVFTNPSAMLKIMRPTVPVLPLTGLTKFIMNAKPTTCLSEKQIQSIAEYILSKHLNKITRPVTDIGEDVKQIYSTKK